MTKARRGQSTVSAATAPTAVAEELTGGGIITDQEDPLLTFTEAAAMIGKSAPTIHRWVAEGLLAAVKDPSGLRRIRQSELEQFYGATAMAKAAAEKQARIDRMRSDRADWAGEIAEMTNAYDERLATEESERIAEEQRKKNRSKRLTEKEIE